MVNILISLASPPTPTSIRLPVAFLVPPDRLLSFVHDVRPFDSHRLRAQQCPLNASFIEYSFSDSRMNPFIKAV